MDQLNNGLSDINTGYSSRGFWYVGQLCEQTISILKSNDLISSFNSSSNILVPSFFQYVLLRTRSVLSIDIAPPIHMIL